jgi:hypothetical protein
MKHIRVRLEVISGDQRYKDTALNAKLLRLVSPSSGQERLIMDWCDEWLEDFFLLSEHF